MMPVKVILFWRMLINIGEFLNREFHGKGTFTSVNGDKYLGNWIKGNYKVYYKVRMAKKGNNFFSLILLIRIVFKL